MKNNRFKTLWSAALGLVLLAAAIPSVAQTNGRASKVVEPGIIVLKGQIDGSGTFVFRKDSVMFRKTGFHEPTGVTINGEVWSNMARPFPLEGESAFVPVRIRTMEEHYITAALYPAGDEAELKLSSASGRTGSFRIELAGPKTDTKGGPVVLEGIFNGIGTFEFNGSRIIYHHIAFQPPREVTVNGRSWPITRGKGVYWMTSGGGDQNPDFELDFVPDFQSMKLAGETGLQKLTLTPSGNGMELYLSDLRQNPERTRIRIEAGSRPAPDANQAEVTIRATGGKGAFSFRDNMVVFEPAARNPLTFPKNVTVNDRSWTDLSMPFRLEFHPGFGKAEILEATGPGFVRTEKKPDNIEFVFDNSNVWGSDPTRFTVLVEKNPGPVAPKPRHTTEVRAELEGTAAAFKFEGSRIICYPLNDKTAKNVTVNGKPWSDLDKPFELGFEINPLRAQITDKQGACTVEQLKYPDSYVLRLDGQGSSSCRVVAELDDGTTAATGTSNKQKTLSFEMKFDGVGRLTFRDNGIYFKLFSGNYPYNVTVNGRPWDDLDQPFALDFVPDFSSATITGIKMGTAAELTPGADHADLLLNTNGSLRDCQLDLTMKKQKDAKPESVPAAGEKPQTPVTRYAGFTGVGPFRPDAAADLGDPRDTAVFEVMTDKPCMFTFQDDTILCGIPEPPTPMPQGYNPPMISVNGRLLNELGKPVLLDFIPDLAHAEVTVSFERRSQITRIADTPVLIRRDGNKMVVRTLDTENGNWNESGSYSVRIKMKKLADSGRDPDVGERMTMNDPKRLMPAGQTQNWGAMMQSIVDAMEGTRLRALDFDAEVAGTGVFEFFGDRIRYLHESGERPSGVTIGGIPWDDLDEPFEMPFVVDNYHETLSYRYDADSPLADYPYKPVSLLADHGRQYLATRTVAAADGGTPCRYHVHYEMTELNQKKAGRGRSSTSATSSLGGLPASGVAPTAPVPEFETVVLEGVLNGRGSFVIQGNTIVHNNNTGREPVRMTVNGKPWDDVKKPFELDFTPDYSARAKLVGTRGRIAPLLSSLSQRVEVSYNDSGAYGDLYRVVFTVQKKQDGK